MKILLVDDDEQIRAALKRYIEDEISGAEVTESWCGNQATGWLRREDFDLIITDLMMTHGDGRVVLNYCTREEITTPIIVNTADTEYSTTLELLSLGATVIVHKSAKDVVDVARRLLRLTGTEEKL